MEKHQNRFKLVVQWTIYIISTSLIFIGYIVPLFRYLVLKEPLSDVLTFMNWIGVALTFTSLILAVFSMAYSSKDSKKSIETLESIKSIQQESINNLADIKRLSEGIVRFQEGTLNNLVSAFINNRSGTKEFKKDSWSPDNSL